MKLNYCNIFYFKHRVKEMAKVNSLIGEIFVIWSK